MTLAASTTGPAEAAAIDPITLQVIQGSFETVAEEMGHVLYRMSFSSIIRESQDLGAGLFDTDFNTICESESTPMHIGSIPGYLCGIAATLDDREWHEGDVVVHNHPYHGASHTPDLAIVVPVFHAGRLVGFAANTAHHIDIGAATPGLIIDVPDVYAEGMLFAGTKLYSRGVANRAMWSFIRNNSRAAQQLVSDIEAQIASARLGARRFVELLDQHGAELVFAASRQLMAYAERLMRARIQSIPDGDYEASGHLDDDGRNRGTPLLVKVTLRVRGDEVEVDLTGSADQTPTAYNVPFEGSTKVAAYAAFRKLLLDPAAARAMPSKFSGEAVGADDVMSYYSPNGDGYGDPLTRPPGQVLEDVLDGFCGIEHARQAYGVVLDLQAERVNLPATEALRASLKG